jgi:hypothetical protein
LFYKNLTDNKTQTNNGTPNINEIKEFWSNIWSNEVQFNNQAEWIPHLENDIPDSNNRHHIQISLEILVKNIYPILPYKVMFKYLDTGDKSTCLMNNRIKF